MRDRGRAHAGRDADATWRMDVEQAIMTALFAMRERFEDVGFKTRHGSGNHAPRPQLLDRLGMERQKDHVRVVPSPRSMTVDMDAE